jgi:hypothetical protein
MSSLGRKTTRANALAMAAMCNADPILIDVQAAIDVTKHHSKIEFYK